jgi:hypothetical protein
VASLGPCSTPIPATALTGQSHHPPLTNKLSPGCSFFFLTTGVWVMWDSESKSPPDGRATGTVRRSEDGGRSWTSVVLNGAGAYSYSCLSKMPTPYSTQFVGLAWETVLPGSGTPKSWSASNVVFTRVPQNLSAAPACMVTLDHQLSESACTLMDFGCFDDDHTSMWVGNGCRGVFTCNGKLNVSCYPCPPRPTACPPRPAQALCSCQHT